MASVSHSKDIEDLKPKEITSKEDTSPNDHKSSDSTKKSTVSIPKNKSDDENRNLCSLSTLNGGIPGSAFVYIKTWGCSHNWSDSEYMAGLLIENGYKVTFKDNESFEANIWILNSCTVKGRAQNLFETALKKAISLGKYVISAGCVPSGDKKNNLWSNVSIIGVQQIDKISYVVEQTLAGNIVQLFKTKNTKNTKQNTNKQKPTLAMPKMRRNKYEEIIPINTGCLNQCTYCKTKHARGDLKSYHISEIIDRIRTVILEDKDIRIINLESEDTGAYGLDIGTNIGELLIEIEKLILNDKNLSRNIMLRLGISNPPYFLVNAEKVSKILLHPKVFSYVHIPVQSGSNKVLYDMKRKYTIQEFEELCNIFKNRINDIHICTDIIVGFPTETEESFLKTLKLIEKWKFTTMYISPFFPRPKTPAAKMDYVYGEKQIDIDRIKKERVREVTQLFGTFEPFNERINTKQFFICHKGLTKDQIHYVGLNKYGEKILVKPPSGIDISGKILEVYVFECGKKYMYATICHEYLDVLKMYPNEINYIELRKELENKKKNRMYFMCMMILLFAVLTFVVISR
eukprot:410684_1